MYSYRIKIYPTCITKYITVADTKQQQQGTINLLTGENELIRHSKIPTELELGSRKEKLMVH